MRAPTVGIHMPVHDGERFLPRAVQTLLDQDFEDFELVISDNASTDGTEEIARAFVASDRRVRYERHDRNRGASYNFNRLFAVSHPGARYLKWAAADDEHHPTYLRRTVALLDDDPGLVLAHSLTADIDEEGFRLRVRRQPVEHLGDPSPATRIRDLVTLAHECFDAFAVVRAETLRATRGVGPFSDADNVLLTEIALRGRFGRVDEVLFFRRQHAERSMASFRTSRQRIAWFDPGRSQDGFPAWRVGRELVGAVHRAPLALPERAACYRSLSVFVRHNWPGLAKNVVRTAASAAADRAVRRGGAARRGVVAPTPVAAGEL